MKNYLEREKKGIMGKSKPVTFQPEEMEDMTAIWDKSQKNQKYLEEEIESLRKQLRREEKENEAKMNSLQKSLENQRDENDQLSKKLRELSKLSEPGRDWLKVNLATENSELALPLSNINEIVQSNESKKITAINGIEVISELTSDHLIAKIRALTTESQANLLAALNE